MAAGLEKAMFSAGDAMVMGLEKVMFSARDVMAMGLGRAIFSRERCDRHGPRKGLIIWREMR